jgi:transcriptional regulator with XRE-family HTH domain
MSNVVRRAETVAEAQPGGRTVSDSAAKSLQGDEMQTRQETLFVRGAVPPSEPTVSPVRRKAVELSAFFERLRQGLDERGMSQADLARELNVGVATVSEWFTRGRVPNGDVMLRLPGALRVNGHWLLTGEGPSHREASLGGDPYRSGAEDALARMSKALDEVARRFGTAAPRADGGAPDPG